MQTGLYFDQTRCVGCNACSVACKDWHDIDPGPENWLRFGYREDGDFPDLVVSYTISTCFHCEDPICADACPAGAIFKRQEDGIVIVDSEKCIGREECGSKCLTACPYDAPQFGPGNNARMHKCDLCLDRRLAGKQPACVESCYTRALDSGSLDDLKAQYGDVTEAVGFSYSKRTKPSIVFKPKKGL